MNACESLIAVIATCMAVGVCDADEKSDPTPQTPTAFETRNTGETAEDEAGFRQNKGEKVRLQFTALTGSREWRDKNGTAIKGRLLAFEKCPDHSDTVIRDGKLRLLVDGAKAFSLLPVAKLSEEDQVFVRNLVAVQKQGAPRSR